MSQAKASRRARHERLPIDDAYLLATLRRLVDIPSPTGYTDPIVHFVGEELSRLGVPFELTRRGAIRADLAGKECSPDRALVAHLDTLGAMVKNLKSNGRLEIVPIGNWSSRFIEGARVTVLTDRQTRRGTVLPVKASGHTFGAGIDALPVAWGSVEVRVDESCHSAPDLEALGFHVGDTIAVDPAPEFCDNGYIVSRHLDDKAGVAILLAVARAIVASGVQPAVECHLLFTISEEVGSGASAILHGDIAEMVSIDNSIPAPGQASTERGVTIAMADSTGPFDWHLTHGLIDLCVEHRIPHARDVFPNYRCDAASAIESGCDIRTALICFGTDGSHGYERTHLSSLRNLADLIGLYLQTPRVIPRDRFKLGPLKDFPTQPDPETEESARPAPTPGPPRKSGGGGASDKK
jgi:peptidase M42 family hydrolase